MSSTFSIVNHIKQPEIMLAKTLEDVICLTVLIATKELPSDSCFSDAEKYLNDIGEDCDGCTHRHECLAYIMNG